MCNARPVVAPMPLNVVDALDVVWLVVHVAVVNCDAKEFRKSAKDVRAESNSTSHRYLGRLNGWGTLLDGTLRELVALEDGFRVREVCINALDVRHYQLARWLGG